MADYITANIRKLLINGFDSRELKDHCFDNEHFHNVLSEVSAGPSSAELAGALLSFAKRRDLMDELLAMAQGVNPAKFQEYGPYTRVPQKLEEQKVGFGFLHAPARIEVEIEDAQAEIERLETALALLEQPEPAPEPGVEIQPSPITSTSGPKVFISYVRQNSAIVDKLAAELRGAGVTVWLDREEIMPGADWKFAIRQAIQEGDYFIACFSAEYVNRPLTYMNTEIGLAIEMLQQMPIGRIWFIPVLLSECKVPDIPISGGRTLSWLHYEALHQNWEGGVRRILKAMGVKRLPPKPVSDLLTIDKPIRMEFVRIPAGEFTMGTRPEDIPDLLKRFGGGQKSYELETPQRRIWVAEFYMGKYPVTNTQYAKFVKATKAKAPQHWANGVIPRGRGKHPVVNITWRDSIAFCRWLSKASGQSVRLPNEFEWEKAARSTDGRIFPWGNNDPTVELCNFGGSNIRDTTPVDRYRKGISPYGVWDMAGNVWEWTGDIYAPYPYKAEDARDDPDASGWRVARGGSYVADARHVRCATRVGNYPDDFYWSYGLRVVVCVPQST